jgi:hypothetical protein
MNFSAFRAEAVTAAVVEDQEAFVVVLAEHADGSGHRLEISRALDFDTQDRNLGLDTFSISDATGACAYGGVLSWELKRGALHLIVTEECSRELGVAGYIVEYAPENEALLREGLKRAFGEK